MGAGTGFPGDDLTNVYEATRKLGLEGIVVTRTDADYEPGRRSPAWVKLKHVKHDALVVGAIRPPTGSRPLSGLVVGWLRDDGRLDSAGSSRSGSHRENGRSSSAHSSGAQPMTASSPERRC